MKNTLSARSRVPSIHTQILEYLRIEHLPLAENFLQNVRFPDQ
jgi:hypothetical protein